MSTTRSTITVASIPPPTRSSLSTARALATLTCSTLAEAVLPDAGGALSSGSFEDATTPRSRRASEAVSAWRLGGVNGCVRELRAEVWAPENCAAAHSAPDAVSPCSTN